MQRTISKTLESFALLLLSVAFVLLCAVSGSGRVSETRVDRSLASLREWQNQPETKSESETQDDPEVKRVLDKMAAAGVAGPTTVADVRKAYLFYPKLSGSPEHVFRIEDRQISGPAGNIPVRVYTPSSTNGLPILVFFHGGGFVAGSLDSHDTPLRSVSNRCECIVVSVAYRLAPENKYPAAPEDAYAATSWVGEHGADIGGDPHRIAVGGDGAGGNLAAVVTLMARARRTPFLVFQLLVYPMLDASTMRPTWWTESGTPTVSRDSKNDILRMYLRAYTSLTDPFVAPLRAENLRELPPALIITYKNDAPMRVESEEYVSRLTQDGVVAKLSLYPMMIHGFFLMAGDLDGAKKCIDEMASALRNAFKGV